MEQKPVTAMARIIADDGAEWVNETAILLLSSKAIVSKGCKRFDLYREDEGDFTVIETWATMADLVNFRKTEEYAEFFGTVNKNALVKTSLVTKVI